MANSLISMIKGDSTLINNTEVLDGQVLFNTDEKTILLDDDNTRTKYCGADKSNKNLAPIENGNTATRGYSAGSYVVWKEQLYKVLTQINSGTAFVVGTNIALDTVGTELTRINSDITLKADKATVNALPVKQNDTHFYSYNASGLNVVNADATAYTDLNCRNVHASGGYVKSGVSGLNVTNNAGNTYLPISASDVKINGAKSVYDSLPKTYSFSNISLTGDGIGYLDYNVLRPSTHIVTSAFGTVASPGELCRFEVLADMTNDVYAIQPWTYKDVKVTSTTANVTIGYFKK